MARKKNEVKAKEPVKAPVQETVEREPVHISGHLLQRKEVL